MQILWLFLLVLLGDPTSEAAELNNDVLADIISEFRAVPDDEPTTEGGGQFAFLLALTEDQCTDDNQDITFTPNINGAPRISGSANYFLNNPNANYMAVYPDTGTWCSESKLLHGRWTEEISPAERFSNLLNDRGMEVGCVILYTTYTPCLDYCLSDDENCEIIPYLNMAPFSDPWANIDKYFVFSEPYRRDTDNRFDVGEKLEQVQLAGFSLHRCDRPQNQPDMECVNCNNPDDCLDDDIRT